MSNDTFKLACCPAAEMLSDLNPTVAPLMVHSNTSSLSHTLALGSALPGLTQRVPLRNAVVGLS
eukprot:CAMPEP_0196789944 /NCGR_PEP_ID=MMETSP1104-20130614/27424_1 /TAXON_ID=33652 /ORGANISM="Cafeteria sp., Strain Caron Lab Isolate" /LENGTH=63 /DNA_ID=CAMNT_0042160309 /DNA_START=98 /DNA_END=285 /DNA_ORIENTATION=-